MANTTISQEYASRFIKSYWNYFLEIEDEFAATKKYVDFEKGNFKTHSIEYLKLLQATCSEIDVVAKEIAAKTDSGFEAKNANIQKWGLSLQSTFPQINDEEVVFVGEYRYMPWAKWKYKPYINEKGVHRIKLADDAKTPSWWVVYNKVKHERTSAYAKNETNYSRASLENLFHAMSALYVLELLFLDKIHAEGYERSRLFAKSE